MCLFLFQIEDVIMIKVELSNFRSDCEPIEFEVTERLCGFLSYYIESSPYTFTDLAQTCLSSDCGLIDDYRLSETISRKILSLSDVYGDYNLLTIKF